MAQTIAQYPGPFIGSGTYQTGFKLPPCAHHPFASPRDLALNRVLGLNEFLAYYEIKLQLWLHTTEAKNSGCSQRYLKDSSLSIDVLIPCQQGIQQRHFNLEDQDSIGPPAFSL